MNELERLQKQIGAAYSVMPVDQLYKINSDLTELQKQNDEITTKLVNLAESKSCATCNNTGSHDYDDGFGGVCSSPCHCTNNPYSTYSVINSTQHQSLSDIRAEAVIEAIEKCNANAQEEDNGERLIYISDLVDHANRIKEG